MAVVGHRRAAEAARRGRPDATSERDASRLLANASMLVQRFVGVASEPVIAEPGKRRDPRGRGRRRPARRRPLGPLAPGGPRPDALGARELGARADPLRPPRRAGGRARAARRRHALHLVLAEHRHIARPAARADDVIGVTGATGALGGRVAARLAERGLEQRLIVRDAARARRRCPAPRSPRRRDYGDGEAMRRALDGVDTLFLVSAGEHPDRVSLHRTRSTRPRPPASSGVVYTSFLGAAPDARSRSARDHFHTEEHIRAAGLGYTFLRDSMLPRLRAVLRLRRRASSAARPATGASARSRATTSPTPPWRRCSTPSTRGARTR